jgi:ABC-type multidrug transport system fused ATPase/permease subunit
MSGINIPVPTIPDPSTYCVGFSENELFQLSAITFHTEQNSTDKQIVNALKKANAYEFVMNFKDGLDAKIGERGVKLSGGQKQRIQIARAILHNKPILILDEATSSLDSKSEKLVHEALDNLIKNRLVIIIAHRFSTIQNADRIIVVDNGIISDMGTPQEMAQRKRGLFRTIAVSN